MTVVRRIAGAAGVIGLVAASMARTRFVRRLDALDLRLANAQTPGKPRGDLPPAVSELAERLGADRANPACFVDLQQAGMMWFTPGAAPRRFTARQRIGTSRSGFVWRADIGPVGALAVVDALVAGRGFLEARLFGIVRVAKIDGSTALNQGEALRYLAELPPNPDTILFDHALDWSVESERKIKVAMGRGKSRAEIVFELDDAGRINSASAASRAFGTTGKCYPWHGRFWDYQRNDGRIIPMQAEVAWVIDGKDFIYWRGKMTRWHAIATA